MRIQFDVKGMTCAACSARVEKVTCQIPGVEKAEVNLLGGSMVVEASENVTTQIIEAVAKAGYQASLPGKKKEDASARNHMGEMKKRIIGSAVFLLILMYFTMGHMLGKCHDRSDPAVFINTACCYFESCILYPWTQVSFPSGTEYGLTDCGWLRRISALWHCGDVPYGLCCGAWTMACCGALQQKSIFRICGNDTDTDYSGKIS